MMRIYEVHRVKKIPCLSEFQAKDWFRFFKLLEPMWNISSNLISVFRNAENWVKSWMLIKRTDVIKIPNCILRFRTRKNLLRITFFSFQWQLNDWSFLALKYTFQNNTFRSIDTHWIYSFRHTLFASFTCRDTPRYFHSFMH